MGNLSRQLWSTDSKKIMEAIRALIDGQFSITLQRQGDRPLQSRIVALHTHRRVPYLLITRPSGLDNAYQVRDLLFKLSGLPILGFSCPVTRDSESILATMLPESLYSLELRQGPRITALPGSMATFFIRGRALVNICHMENISMGGAKLLGQPSHSVGLNDMIGPCTLSLAGQNAVISREVTINTAAVVRVEQQGRQQGLGLKFALSDSEENQLQEQLDYLTQAR